MVPNKEWIHIKNRLSREFAVGCKKFLDWACGVSENTCRIRCPCNRCRNTVFSNRETVHYHIYIWGFYSAYTCWEYHGENEQNMSTANNPNDIHGSRDPVDELEELLEDVADHLPSGDGGETSDVPNSDIAEVQADVGSVLAEQRKLYEDTQVKKRHKFVEDKVLKEKEFKRRKSEAVREQIAAFLKTDSIPDVGSNQGSG